MAVRAIVHIDEEKCDGCGVCVPSCAEGAIKVMDGKARLVSESLCDGLGACLGDCPQGAITVEKREADEFDENAVKTGHSGPVRTPPSPRTEKTGFRLPMAVPHAPHPPHPGFSGCPGSRTVAFEEPEPSGEAGGAPAVSALRQWPVQLHLVSPGAPYFQGADLLLAADCTAFSMGDFHTRHLPGKALAVACPKLDHGQEMYLQKLVALIDQARINTVTVLIMEVPCCGGLTALVKEAAALAGRKVPIKRLVVGIRGEVRSEEWI